MKYASDEIEWLVFSGKRKEELSTASKNFTTFNEQNFSTKWLRHSVCELLIIYCSEIGDWKNSFLPFQYFCSELAHKYYRYLWESPFWKSPASTIWALPKELLPLPPKRQCLHMDGILFFIKVLPYEQHDDVVIVCGYSEFNYFARQ